MKFTYQIGDKLYLNITNRCNCACEFCIRNNGDAFGDSDNLWLDKEPDAAAVISELKSRDLKNYGEIVFCGYGEPTESLEVMLDICRFIKNEALNIPVRLNTNGLCELSLERPVAPLLRGLIDVISISLNAPDPERYQEVTRSIFGRDAFYGMLEFAKSCKKHVPRVIFTVVDILTPEEIERCKKLAEDLEIPFRVREKS